MINSRDINLLRQDVAANCFLWRDRCRAAGLSVLVTNTVRDDEYQAYLYEQGRTRPGGIVTTPRTMVQYVATEYGVVNLKYKSCLERARALISIAHPDFRGELERSLQLR